ncbi:MAG: adenosylcobalamin-dependent ribonucleoside-diphosphate reductase [Nanopusillaceae archaeon]
MVRNINIDHETVKKENDMFIETIIRKKYCHDNENSLKDIKERFRKVLSKVKDFTDVDYFIDEMLFNTFIPGGSIIYGFGSEKNISMSNCYYIPILEDSIEGISKAMSENMKVFSWRGGVGNSFEILRPKGSPVNNAAKTSTGSVSFMPLFSNATQTIGQNGRRGASIFSHAIWHPDILDFIKSKAHPEEVFEKDLLNNTLPKITGANISVKLTDEFMKAVENDDDWNLVFPDLKDPNYSSWNGDIKEWKGSIKVYKTVKARDLMKLIAESAWNYAEPGVLYWDTVVNNTPMSVIPQLKPRGVNPCGEEILADYDSCNLGAMVLYKFVKNPYTPKASFDYERFKKDVQLAVEFMDIVLDMNKHPLKEQNEINMYGRKIGLGITGLADMLAMSNEIYGSDSSLNLVRDVLSRKAIYEVDKSISLAITKGMCPALTNSKLRTEFSKHKYFKNLENISKKAGIVSYNIPDKIKTYGLRNISLSTIAPTGTISIVMGNCTSGIEPLFSFEYYRKSNLIDKKVR